MNQKVYEEVHEAYIDCNELPDDALERRNLDFRASEPVTRDEAIEILEKCVPAYNDFKPKLLFKLPPSVAIHGQTPQIFIAREGSVCVYVKGEVPQNLRSPLKADEFSYNKDTDETRIW